MKIREYFHNLQRLNEEELPNLPPFGVGQNLTQDEMLDILLFGTPRSWQNEMERQGFDPMEKTIQEVVDFMENLESVEPPKEERKAKMTVPKKENKSSGKKKPTHFCKGTRPKFFPQHRRVPLSWQAFGWWWEEVRQQDLDAQVQ